MVDFVQHDEMVAENMVAENLIEVFDVNALMVLVHCGHYDHHYVHHLVHSDLYDYQRVLYKQDYHRIVQYCHDLLNAPTEKKRDNFD